MKNVRLMLLDKMIEVSDNTNLSKEEKALYIGGFCGLYNLPNNELGKLIPLNLYEESISIQSLFTWEESPQGHDFWSKLNRKLK